MPRNSVLVATSEPGKLQHAQAIHVRPVSVRLGPRLSSENERDEEHHARDAGAEPGLYEVVSVGGDGLHPSGRTCQCLICMFGVWSGQLELVGPAARDSPARNIEPLRKLLEIGHQ